MKIEKNQRQCPYCKEILTSTNNYDLKSCECGHLTIDGGAENLRVITNEVPSKQPTVGSDRAKPIGRKRAQGKSVI